jgi:uncharacterized protein YkwD
MRRHRLAVLVGSVVLVCGGPLIAAEGTKPGARISRANKNARATSATPSNLATETPAATAAPPADNAPSSSGTPSAGKPSRPSPAERRDLSRGLSNFRKARNAPKRMEATRQVLRLGPEGAKALLAVIETELHQPLERYREAFARESAAVLSARGVNLQEVAQLRASVIARAQEQNLTEGSIREQSDPAVARLNMLLGVDRVQVLQAKPNLKKQRTELTAYGPSWEACQAALGPEATGSGTRGSFDAFLAGEETMAAQFALPFPPQAHMAMASNAQVATALDPEEAAGILMLNMTRLTLGMNPLLIDTALCDAARDHSNDMVTLKFFSHESPVPGKRTFGERAARFNTKGDGENIAHGAKTGADAIRMWWYSPGHHKNMLGNYRRVGLGRSGTHWTQMFGR